ncbi:hypothetical protein [Listeria aquatica]|uniref:Uncharacterized protein n=1 Tax=Listeria aquatica FSL S10-1188 TaxID=1265818 RepID=W7ASK9_9LIST|nr:hypothetical protein [Listeria aquatica]EUJ16602.1 hypothetical protein MAQA_15736 [Listeria aquatica FSL S10-1188]
MKDDLLDEFEVVDAKVYQLGSVKGKEETKDDTTNQETEKEDQTQASTGQETTVKEEKEGTEITDQGELTIDDAKSQVDWITTKTEDKVGQKLRLVIQAKVRDGANLSKYEKDGKYVLDNTGDLLLDEEDPIHSNKVDIIIEKEKTPDPVKNPVSVKEIPKTGSEKKLVGKTI